MTTIKELKEKKKHMEFIINYLKGEAKQKILSDVSTLSNNAKRTLKYLESRGVGCSVAEICIKGFMYKDGGGGYSKIVNDAMKELSGIIVGEKQTNGKCFGRLRERIKQLLEVQEAKPEEMEQVYNHIVMEILKNGGTN